VVIFLFYEKNNIKLYYEVHGKGVKNIVILPGWGDNRITFYPLINHLLSDYKIYIIDLFGFGNSPFLNQTLTIYEYSLFIKEWMEDLEINNPYIIAHSFGGRVAILLCAYYKVKIEKLILIDSAGIVHKKTLNEKIKLYSYKFLKSLNIFLSKKQKEKYLTYLFSKFASNDYMSIPKSQRETFKNIVNEDLSFYLKDILTSTLILWGENDLDTPLSDGKIMEKNIKNSALISFPKAGHFCYLDYQERINLIIESFFKSK